jgi:hypothetical protein
MILMQLRDRMKVAQGTTSLTILKVGVLASISSTLVTTMGMEMAQI